jgi:hypothetical protein
VSTPYGGHCKSRPAVTTPHHAIPSTCGLDDRESPAAAKSDENDTRMEPLRTLRASRREKPRCALASRGQPTDENLVSKHERAGTSAMIRRTQPASQDRCANTFRWTPQVEARRDDASSHRPGHVRPGDRDLPVDAKSDETANKRTATHPCSVTFHRGAQMHMCKAGERRVAGCAVIR